MSSDMSQYRQIFLDEGQEQIDVLEEGFLALEGSEADDELLQSLFRAAHTVKGSSRAMEYNNIGELTHEMENVLDDLRNRRLSISTPIVNALLKCLDCLKGLLAVVVATGGDQLSDRSEIDELVSVLSAVRLEGAGGSPAPAHVELAPASRVMEELGTYVHDDQETLRVDISIDPACPMKSVRAITVICALEPLGHVVDLNPSREDLEEERFDFDFSVWMVSEVPDSEIRNALGQLSEIAGIRIERTESVTAEVAAPVSVDAITKSIQSAPKLQVEAGGAKDAAVVVSATHGQAANQTIRVGVNRLDALLNLVGELVIDRTQIARICSQLHDRFGSDDLVGSLTDATNRVARITSELQDEIMKTRMLPIDGVFQRMPRMVRDLAQKTGKQVDLQISGGETELDRSLLDAIGDPLIHLLRNSIDHGVETPEERKKAGKAETGAVRLSATHAESYIQIQVVDDGKGIDAEVIKASAVRKGLITEVVAETMSEGEALRLIFASGLSTAKEVSEISGRGVGMDIVRSNLEKVGGRIEVESKVGIGTTFTIRLPLTLAIVRALLVKVDGSEYAIPLQHVVETLRLGKGEADIRREKIGSRCVMVLRGDTVPLVHLESALQNDFGASAPGVVREDTYVVVVGVGLAKVGLCVDRLLGEQEVVIKSLGNYLGDVHGVSGASILGDGRVALIVDPTRVTVGAA